MQHLISSQTRGALFCALASFSLLASCAAEDEPDLSDVSAELGNGLIDTSNTPQANAVVGWGGCTGVLISPQHILTSAHCGFINPVEPGLDAQGTGEWYFAIPGARAQAGMTSGRKRLDGTMTLEVGYDRPGADLRNVAVANASACRSTCAADEACKAYTYIAGNSRCYLKSPGSWRPVTFGPDSDNAFTTHVLAMALPGREDFLIAKLTEPVPANVATPIPPLLSVPGNDPLAFFGDDWIKMVGYGAYYDETGREVGGDGRRRVGWAKMTEYPYRSFGVLQPNMFLLAEGYDCATVLPGDSGSPALWTDPEGRTYVVGIAQGSQACGGRYLATFGVGGTASDGTPKPNLGAYLGQQLAVTGVDFVRDARMPSSTFARIAACDDGRMLGMTSGGRLHQWVPGATSWAVVAELGAGVKDLDCHANAPIFLDASNRVRRRLSTTTQTIGTAPSNATDLAYAGGNLWVRRSDSRAYELVSGTWRNRTHGGTEIERTAQHLLTAAAWSTNPGRHFLYLRDLAKLSSFITLGAYDATDFDMHHPATSTEPVFYRQLGAGIDRGVLIRGNAPVR